MTYLTAAYTIIWLALAVFHWQMGRKLTRMETELVRIEGSIDQDGKRGGTPR